MSQISEPLRRDYIIRFGAALATQEAAGAKEKAPSQGPQVQTRPREPPHRWEILLRRRRRKYATWLPVIFCSQARPRLAGNQVVGMKAHEFMDLGTKEVADARGTGFG